MLWPTSAGGTPERSSACFEATAPSSIAERSFSVPPKVPKPVRTPERNTTSVFEPWVFIGGKLHVRRGEYRGDGGRAVGRVVLMPLNGRCFPSRTRGSSRGSALAAQAATSGPFTGRRRAASSLAHATAKPRPGEVRRHPRRHDPETNQALHRPGEDGIPDDPRRGGD